MKNNLILIVLSIFIFTSCGDGGANETLTSENEELKMKLEAQDSAVVSLNRVADDYLSQINNLKDEIYAIQGEEEREPLYPQEYLELIKSVHEGWEELLETGSKDKLMSNFMVDYSVNGVRFFGKDNVVVGQGGKEEFEGHLENVAKSGGQLSVGSYDIGYFAAYENDFVLSMKVEYTWLQGSKKDKRTIIEVWSGKNTAGGLKIGNYSWVNIPSK